MQNEPMNRPVQKPAGSCQNGKPPIISKTHNTENTTAELNKDGIPNTLPINKLSAREMPYTRVKLTAFTITYRAILPVNKNTTEPKTFSDDLNGLRNNGSIPRT